MSTATGVAHSRLRRFGTPLLLLAAVLGLTPWHDLARATGSVSALVHVVILVAWLVARESPA